MCKSIDAENILSQWPSSYVYENEDLYSMHVSTVVLNSICLVDISYHGHCVGFFEEQGKC